MKQRVPLILGIAACVLSALCLWQFGVVQAKLDQMAAKQAEYLSSLEATIQSVPGQIDSTITTQNSLPRVAFSEEGRQRVQVLDIHVVPGEEDLPLFTSNLYYKASYEDGTVCLRHLNLDMELTTCIPVWTTMSLVAKADGKELGRQPVTPPVEDGDEWLGLSQILGDITYPVAQGKTLSLSLEASDPQGLRYVAPLVELTPSKNGIFPAGSDQFTSDTIEIYSPQGKLLWSGSPYLY